MGTFPSAPKPRPLFVYVPDVVHGDYPFGLKTWIAPGFYEAVLNPQGAVSVVARDGAQLGLKPLEFEWACPCGAGVWDRRQIRECTCGFNPTAPASGGAV